MVKLKENDFFWIGVGNPNEFSHDEFQLQNVLKKEVHAKNYY